MAGVNCPCYFLPIMLQYNQQNYEGVVTVKSLEVFGREATPLKNELRNYLLSDIKRVVEGWDKSDIYAISLFVQDNLDNPCEPTVTLGYNTEENFRSQIEDAWDEAEARWNYAFWLQNEEYILGLEDTQAIVKQWINAKGFHYYTYEEMFCADQEPSPQTYEGITEAFVKELIAVVKELHESGFIRLQFGKDIPVLIHELEYYDQIAEQNLAANPPHIMGEFVKFCTEG